jgi:transcriptional regulator with XRE-family HTH domain
MSTNHQPPRAAGTFAARLTSLREAKGLLRSELARAAGISGAQVTRLEQGLQLPRLDTLYQLAAALGVDVVELIRPRKEKS